MRDLHPAEIYDRGERAYVAYVTGGGAWLRKASP